MSTRSWIHHVPPLLCFLLIGACGSSGGKSAADGGGGSSAAGTGGSSAAGTGGSNDGGGGGAQAGSGGSGIDGGTDGGAQSATMFLPSTYMSTTANVVYRYTITPNADPTLSTQILVPAPSGMALSAKGELFVATYAGAGVINRFLSPLGMPTANGMIGGLSSPEEMRFVGDELWVVNSGASNIVRVAFDAQGTASVAGIAVSALVGDRGMLWDDAKHELYVSLFSSNQVQHYTVATDHTATALPIITGNGLNAPHGMVITSWGEIFVANEGGTSIARFLLDAQGAATPNGSITGNGLATPIGLAFAPWGELFVANNGGMLSRFTFDASHAAVPNGTFMTAANYLNWILIAQ